MIGTLFISAVSFASSFSIFNLYAQQLSRNELDAYSLILSVFKTFTYAPPDYRNFLNPAGSTKPPDPGLRGPEIMDNDSGSKIVYQNEVHISAEPHDGERIVDQREDNDLSRALKGRHIQMIALAGAIVRIQDPTSHKLFRRDWSLIFFAGHRPIFKSWRCTSNGWPLGCIVR